MKRNLNVVVTDMYGDAVEYQTGKMDPKTNLPILVHRTLCYLIVGALGSEVQGEMGPNKEAIDGNVKMERYELAIRLRPLIDKDEEAELSDREVALIKSAMDAKFAGMVIGPLFNLLKAQ